MNTAVPGISTKAVLVPIGDDAKDAVNVVTTNRNAMQSYGTSLTKCHVTTAAMNTWKPNVISYGSSQGGIFTPTKS